VPVIAFMFERVEHAREANFFQHGVDFLVFSLAVGRVAGSIVFLSIPDPRACALGFTLPPASRARHWMHTR